MLIDPLSLILPIAFPNNSATDKTLILELSYLRGIESVTTNSVNTELVMFSLALPERTGCVQNALTDLAPLAKINSAALQMVPPVSI